MTPPRIPRDQIPWYPTIDLAKRTGDQVCVQFCPHAVYRWDPATNRPVVADPYNCVVGCNKGGVGERSGHGSPATTRPES